MTVSTLTTIPAIAERSAATPGLWNSTYSIIQKNLDELNQQSASSGSALFTRGTGTDAYRFGSGSTASGEYSAAFGANTFVNKPHAAAWGSGASSAHTGAWALGPGAITSAVSQFLVAPTMQLIASQASLSTVTAGPLSAGAMVGSTLSLTGNAALSGVTASQLSLTGNAAFSGVTASQLSLTGDAALSTVTASSLSVVGHTALSTASAATLQVTSLLTVGTQLVINQGANDGEILTLKSSDVAHGMTTVTETDTYLAAQKASGPAGGGKIYGLSEGARALDLFGSATTGDTTKSAAADGAIVLDASLKNGTGVTAMASTQNLVVIRNNGAVRFIFQADGTPYQDAGTTWTNFDTHDDIELLNRFSAHVTRDNDPKRDELVPWMGSSRTELEALQLLAPRASPSDGTFINLSKLIMLQVGALRQLGARLARSEQSLAAMASRGTS